MEKIIAYCGLICNDCPIFISAKNNDLEQKIKLSKEYSNSNYKVSSEEINCTGCHADSKIIFKFCNECEIRLCGIEKGKDNCGYCEEYPCKKLEIPLENSPENKKNLDQIRKRL